MAKHKVVPERLSRRPKVEARCRQILCRLSIEKWRRCIDVGGANQSTHFCDLRKLVGMGLVTSRCADGRKRSPQSKAHKKYQLTELGVAYMKRAGLEPFDGKSEKGQDRWQSMDRRVW